MSNENGLTNSEQLFNDMQKAVSEGDMLKIKELVIEPEPAKEEPAKIAETTPEPAKEAPKVEANTDETVVVAAEKKEETPNSEAKTEEKPKETHNPFAWVDLLPGEHQERVRTLVDDLKHERATKKQLQQSHRSTNGRIAAYQRTVANLKTQLDTRPRFEDIAAKSTVKDEDFENLVENDPRLAAYLQKRDQLLVKNLSEAFNKRMEDVVNPLLEGQREQANLESEDFYKSQRDLVKQQVPNVEEVVKSDLFNTWLKDVATDQQKALALSPLAEDGITALKIYSGWLYREGHVKMPEPTQTTKPIETKPVVASDPKADLVAQARAQKSPVASSVTSSSAVAIPSQGADPNDPEALFKHIYNEQLKKLKR